MYLLSDTIRRIAGTQNCSVETTRERRLDLAFKLVTRLRGKFNLSRKQICVRKIEEKEKKTTTTKQ